MVKLSLTTSYILETKRKVKRAHRLIVKVIIRACGRQDEIWSHLLLYVLWTDRTTHSLVTKYMLADLMFEWKPIRPVEQMITSWMAIEWANAVSPNYPRGFDNLRAD